MRKPCFRFEQMLQNLVSVLYFVTFVFLRLVGHCHSCKAFSRHAVITCASHRFRGRFVYQGHSYFELRSGSSIAASTPLRIVLNALIWNKKWGQQRGNRKVQREQKHCSASGKPVRPIQIENWQLRPVNRCTSALEATQIASVCTARGVHTGTDWFMLPSRKGRHEQGEDQIQIWLKTSCSRTRISIGDFLMFSQAEITVLQVALR